MKKTKPINKIFFCHKKNNMTIDIETSKFDRNILLNYTIYSYAERDTQIYNETGVNVLEFMFKKAKKYNIDFQTPRQNTIEEIIEQREFRAFYALFSIEDLCVLGY
jgi:hypothetical protein